MNDRQHMIETIRMWWGDPRGASDIADAIIDGGRWVPRTALDAAQDEIEKLISEKETLRAERDDIQRRFDLTWAYAKPRVTVMTSVPNPASSPGGAS